MNMEWDPKQYLAFANPRQRPFVDLIAHIPLTDPKTIVDLGCGPGTATVTLHERWPRASILGIDSSKEMIDLALERAIPHFLTFDVGDLRTWKPDHSMDLILSAATLQWVPHHVDLFPSFVAALAPLGVFAFKVPNNFDAPHHTALRDLATSPRWKDQLANLVRREAVKTTTEYLDILTSMHLQVDAWETTYEHLLEGPDPIVQWTLGSALRPYVAVLSPHEREEFIESYRTRLAAAFPIRQDGYTLFPFTRTFVIATKPGA